VIYSRVEDEYRNNEREGCRISYDVMNGPPKICEGFALKNFHDTGPLLFIAS